MISEMGQSANIVEAEEEQQQNLIGLGASAGDQVIPPEVAQADGGKTPTRRVGGFRGGRSVVQASARPVYARSVTRCGGSGAHAGPFFLAIPDVRVLQH